MSVAMVVTAAEKRRHRVDLRQLPAIAKQRIGEAEFPAMYQAARVALRECCLIDEVKDVKDKHEALALYAKQAKDKLLLYYAERIKLRAYARIGQLLAKIDKPERSKVAKDYGIAGNSAAWAYNAAHIPKRNLDKLIDQTPPPKIKTLSDYGIEHTPEAIKWREKHKNEAANCGSGFHLYVDEEYKHRPSAAKIGIELIQYLSDVNEEIENIMSGHPALRPQDSPKITSMREIALAVPKAAVSECRKIILPLIERLDELDQYLPKDAD